jgi:ketosteroid isomerase-like protein
LLAPLPLARGVQYATRGNISALGACMHAESSMTKYLTQLGLLILILFLLEGPVLVYADTPAQPPAQTADELFKTIAALDAEFFDAYNTCDLEKFAALMVEDVEFYHDQGGVTWTRQEVVDAVNKNICHKVRRELVAGTLAVSPIKGFGAFETADHRFCMLDTGKCVGIAKTAMLWRLKDGRWQLTRIVSYDHRPINP